MRHATTLLCLALTLTACSKKKDERAQVQTAVVERRTIVIDAEATGVVEPINVIEVKSKASGQIVRMPVETGTEVKPGDLLVQVDTRDVQNQYNQALADVRAAQARAQVSRAQKQRSDDLFGQRIVTAQEHEAAQLDYANAQAQLVRARANLDLAQQRLEDATVRAPVAGTVIEKTVSLGQVITSATGAFGGGTTLLKMADLNQVRVRALVDETDIGQVQPGQQATVTVDAYPDRPFRGAVEKIEPQAVVQQSVTMFPVLVSIQNREGLLKPGMNGEVSILIDRRENVLAVPNDAVRNPREAMQAATALGLDPRTVQQQMQAQFAGGPGGPPGGNGGNGGAPAVRSQSRGDVEVAAAPGAPAGARDSEGGGQQRQQLPDVTPQQCEQVQAAFARKPDAQGRLDALRDRVRSGEIDREQFTTASRAIYDSLGVDMRTAMACRMRARGGGPGGAPAGGGTSGARPQGSAPSGAQVQMGVREGPGVFPGGARTRSRPGLVFLADSNMFKPQVVRLGASNYDFSEVLSGLKEGDRVALLAAATLQAQRQQNLDRFRGMTGGGVPGMSRQQGGGPGGGSAPRGGGGGTPRGGGRP